ncbi:expressed unknown protein [Seminavis robusta]|uniref:ZC3H15/TMA46 family C-terminal domain-containing protein n=1 Tax=Seminavis robusta TaxID=568900 RepID=A0A9N8HYG7_9STRA|nr:expressed unknown protein [Seminavis robusta]|eukprot:Sro2884_g339310.1 n/a (300) ;mRNA; r:960-2189
MAKKKGGDDASKKSVQKKKNQAIEDKTFGLKNKNKSKKVQQHIQSVQKSVLNSGDPRQRKQDEARAKAKADAKARKKAMKEEQDALFGAALLAVSKKKTTDKKGGKVEAKGRDADDEGNKKSTSRAMKMMFQMDAQEMNDKLREDPNYVPTLEDEIEMQRQTKIEELKKSGKSTPITEATFKEWQERKRKVKAEAAKKLVEAEMKKKKGGKGLAVLSGRALYEYKKSLFTAGDEEEDVDTSIPEPDDEDTTATNNDTTTEQEKQQSATTNGDVANVAAKVETDLFLEGDDDDLDDLEDD